jgi:iron complex transport system substrate-binding protein
VWCLLLAALGASCGPAGPAGEPSGAPAHRIISLAPNLTEILFALELGDRVVGVTDHCNHPPEAAAVARVGGFVNPNLEVVVGLQPDLVVATPNVSNREVVLRLQSLGVEFLIVDPDDLAGLWAAIREIAARAGVPERGEALAADLEAQVESIRRRLAPLPPTPALMIFSRDPLIVAGPGTFFDEMLAAAGGDNLAAGAGTQFPQFSLEEVVRQGPEVLIETSMGSGDDGGREFWSRWDTIPAVRNGRICAPDTDVITRPGPRVATGIRLLADCLHPGTLGSDDATGEPSPGGP